MVTMETMAINSHSVCTFAHIAGPQLPEALVVHAANLARSVVDVKNMDTAVVALDSVVVVSLSLGVFQDCSRSGWKGLRSNRSC